MSDRYMCACGQMFRGEASLTTHLEANPEHWRPGRMPESVKARIQALWDNEVSDDE